MPLSFYSRRLTGEENKFVHLIDQYFYEVSDYTIKIPASVSDNFGDPLNYVLTQLCDINLGKKTKICLDFTKCRFLNPFILAGIAALIRWAKKKEITIDFKFNEENESFLSYIQAIHFPDGFKYDNYQLDELNTILEPYHHKNFIPLVLFPTQKTTDESHIRERVISAIDSIFKNRLNLNGQILNAIYYLVTEFSQNIVDHSDSDKGIIFAQFYPSKNHMDLCICDTGKGLRQSYLDSGKFNPSTDIDAIELSLSGQSTKDHSGSRGFGIRTSKKMLVEGLKGKFFLLTGKAFFYEDVEKQNLVSLPTELFYPGCYVALRIPIFDNQKFNFYKYVE